jgi:Uma2 family endonuclease
MTAALQLPSLLDEKQDWTVDDLTSLPKDLRYELIDGRLILPSPTYFHQEVAAELRSMLLPSCPPGYRPVLDMSLEVDRRNEPRPDVVVLPMTMAMRTPIPVEHALVLVEVVSPSSHIRDWHTKAKIFAKARVASYWIVDPSFDGGVVLTEFRIGEDGRYELITSTNKVFETDAPFPVTINVPALTAFRDECRRAEMGQ